jgi:hypothetical protein
VAKQQPTPEPVPDDEVPERIVADPATQEAGHSDWQGQIYADLDKLRDLADRMP